MFNSFKIIANKCLELVSFSFGLAKYVLKPFTSVNPNRFFPLLMAFCMIGNEYYNGAPIGAIGAIAAQGAMLAAKGVAMGARVGAKVAAQTARAGAKVGKRVIVKTARAGAKVGKRVATQAVRAGKRVTTRAVRAGKSVGKQVRQAGKRKAGKSNNRYEESTAQHKLELERQIRQLESELSKLSNN